MASSDWSIKEVKLIVADYFDMLQKELLHISYSKTEHRLALLPKLNNRSAGSVEFKHANISAVLKKMDTPFITGYKPRPNYQALLAEEVAIYMRSNTAVLEESFKRSADEKPSVDIPFIKNYDDLLAEGPEPMEVNEDDAVYFTPVKIDYFKREQHNRALGEKGEQLVFGYERHQLNKAGRKDLADKVKWISKDSGDGAGYDILSKHLDGTDKYIEVKTTSRSKEASFFVTDTEIEFASLHADNFYLYRVYNFNSKPQFFIKQGSYSNFCNLKPTTFRGSF